MTRERYFLKLKILSLKDSDIANFMNEVLLSDADVLDYTRLVREFLMYHFIGEIDTKKGMLINEFMRSIVSCLIGHRTGISSPVRFTIEWHLPRPSKESVAMALWHYDKKKRELRENSHETRGFYENGYPSSTCGRKYRCLLRLCDFKKNKGL